MAVTGFKDFFSDPPIIGDQLRISGIGIQEPMPPAFIHRPEGRPDHLLMCFLDPINIPPPGKSAMEEHAPPTIIWWPPGVRQSYLGLDPVWRHSWVHWSGRLIDEKLPQCGLHPAQAVRLPGAWEIERALADLHEEITLQMPWDPEVLLHLANLLMLRLQRALRPREARKPLPPRRLLELKRQILLEPERDWRLDEMARQAGCSVTRLCQLFKAGFGVSPKAFVIQCRINRARDLLQRTDLSVTQIAEQVGYEDVFHFSKLFRQHSGITATAFRRAE